MDARLDFLGRILPLQSFPDHGSGCRKLSPKTKIEVGIVVLLKACRAVESVIQMRCNNWSDIMSRRVCRDSNLRDAARIT